MGNGRRAITTTIAGPDVHDPRPTTRAGRSEIQAVAGRARAGLHVSCTARGRLRWPSPAVCVGRLPILRWSCVELDRPQWVSPGWQRAGSGREARFHVWDVVVRDGCSLGPVAILRGSISSRRRSGQNGRGRGFHAARRGLVSRALAAENREKNVGRTVDVESRARSPERERDGDMCTTGGEIRTSREGRRPGSGTRRLQSEAMSSETRQPVLPVQVWPFRLAFVVQKLTAHEAQGRTGRAGPTAGTAEAASPPGDAKVPREPDGALPSYPQSSSPTTAPELVTSIHQT